MEKGARPLSAIEYVRGRRKRGSARRSVAWLVAGIAACTGTVESGPPAPSADERGFDRELETGGATNRGDPRAPRLHLSAPTLHRLNVDEYRATVADLLGEGVQIRSALEADTALKGFTSIGATELTIANTTAEKLEAAALEATRQVFDEPARRAALIGCDPAQADAACIGDFVARFGRRAFRRALSEDERAQFIALAAQLEQTLGDRTEALAYTTAAFLQSPHFVFRVELGAPDPELPGRLRYTGYEMASRLSYALWRSMPDEALLAAAEEGALDSREGVRAAAERMIDAPRFRSSMRRFFSEQLALDRLDTLAKEPAIYPQLTPTLKRAMRAELELRFDDVVFTEPGDYRALIDGRTTFVDAELAKLYGLGGITGSATQKVSLPADGPRAGIFGSAALLSIHAAAGDTSPTRRGKFIRGQILCQEIPPPPEGTNFALENGEAGAATMRTRLTAHRERTECAGCHAMMDPIGLAFEHFDGIGAFRASDHGLAIDPSGMLDGMPFDGPVALLGLLRTHPALPRCVARQLFRYATGHQETADEGQIIADLSDVFVANAYRLPALVLALVTSDAFRFASPSEEAGGGE